MYHSEIDLVAMSGDKNFKMTVLEDYLELEKTVKTGNSLRPEFSFFGAPRNICDLSITKIIIYLKYYMIKAFKVNFSTLTSSGTLSCFFSVFLGGSRNIHDLSITKITIYLKYSNNYYNDYSQFSILASPDTGSIFSRFRGTSITFWLLKNTSLH